MTETQPAAQTPDPSAQKPSSKTAGSRRQSWTRVSSVPPEDIRWAEEHGLDWRDMLQAGK